MTKTRGVFLCIEGGDGSGKSTQYDLLAAHFEKEGQQLLRVNFPQYGQPSAELVELYLRNEFGDATKLDPRLASLPYAIDRLAATPSIVEALAAGNTVLAGRFTASNMAYQGAKLTDRRVRIQFFKWLESLEGDIMRIPQPDRYFILHVPADIALRRVQQRDDGSPTGKKIDGHEVDLAYQTRAEQTYLDLVEAFPSRFELIECVNGTYEKTPAEIHEEIWRRVKELIS
ncbi:MAG TPA: dTMP kinase [Verrucomicrobiae bacterium]|nr:dTMP kinase [Verrucomicrobiae bacterium]